MREFTPDEKMQILADLRAQGQAEDAAWIAQLRAKGWCYTTPEYRPSSEPGEYRTLPNA